LELAYGLQILDNLHERVGEEEQLRGRTDLQDGQYANGAWARLIGWTAEYQAASLGIFNGGPKYDANLFAVQGGLDIYRAEHEDGTRDHAGAYFAYGSVDADVTNFNGQSAGSASLNNNVSLGGYWTHFGSSGQYLDAVVQGTWYNVSTDAGRGFVLDGNAQGLALSLEGGWPLPLGGGWEVEPQGQLVYQTVNNDQMNDGAALVRFENVDSLAGRIGARFAHTFAISNDPQPRLVTFWIRPNLWYEFLPVPTTEFSSQNGFVPFHPNSESWLGELNLGTTVELSRTASLYANADYSFDFHGRFQGLAGKVGFRFNW
jgi:outer membrane autotransporter protein